MPNITVYLSPFEYSKFTWLQRDNQKQIKEKMRESLRVELNLSYKQI